MLSPLSWSHCYCLPQSHLQTSSTPVTLRSYVGCTLSDLMVIYEIHHINQCSSAVGVGIGVSACEYVCIGRYMFVLVVALVICCSLVNQLIDFYKALRKAMFELLGSFAMVDATLPFIQVCLITVE